MNLFQPSDFQTATLCAAPWGRVVTQVLAAAVQAVDPAVAVHRFLHRHGQTLVIDGRGYDMQREGHALRRVFLVAAGKAAVPMARAAFDVVGDWLVDGLVIAKDTGLPDPSLAPDPLSTCFARHPLPDEQGVVATQRVAAMLEQTTTDDLVLVLISGGGSALLTLPERGVSLDDIQQLTGLLLGCGATINEINTLRKHLDRVKGGGLARMAAPSSVATLILSDVVGNPLDVIASGPTVPDPTTFHDAWSVLQRFDLTRSAPPSMVAHIQAGMGGERAETPAADAPIFERGQWVLVGSNQQAAIAALEMAHTQGVNPLLLTTSAQGEARVAGQLLAAVARELATTGGTGGNVPALLPRPVCLVAGGETTVTLHGDGRDGKGGRNQELALAAVRELAGLSDVALVTLATDGEDGPTDAAGVVVTGETLARAHHLGLDPDAALANHDAYPFFAALGDLVQPGATGTNVNDLVLVFVW